MTADLRDILHTPYELGGRTVGVKIDCLGVAREICRRRGRPPPEGTQAILDAWSRGEIESATGFPAGWKKQDPTERARDGDVFLFFEPQAWCGIIDGGQFWSASAETGFAYCMPLFRMQRAPDEVWRWQP